MNETLRAMLARVTELLEAKTWPSGRPIDHFEQTYLADYAAQIIMLGSLKPDVLRALYPTPGDGNPPHPPPGAEVRP